MIKIIDDLNWRYATKAFDPNKKVSKEDLDDVIEAFRLTASSFGLQPWKLVIVENQELREKLVEHSWGQKQVVDASHLLVLCRKTDLGDNLVDSYIDNIVETRGGSKEDLKGYEDMMKSFLLRLSEGEKVVWASNQVNIALGNLLTVLAVKHIDSCPMEGFISEKYDEILGLNEKGLSSVLVLPIGYRDENDKYIDLPKVRFDTKDIVEII